VRHRYPAVWEIRSSSVLRHVKPSIGLTERADNSRDPVDCRMAASPSREVHLARTKQVGEGVSPTLDAKADVPRSAARIQECARVTSARCASYSGRQLLAKAAIAASRVAS
jgi:hypothetical protein